ncbi:MAG: IS3 family transposase, partial [Nitrosomonas sp. PRO4]|nr:IS3 family transposase [Nitrosomonas sp. PRO4]
DGLFRERNEVKYSFITQRKKTYPVGLMCQLMGVSRSAYYGYVRCVDNCSESQLHEEILEAVRDIAKSSNYSYGSRRIGKALNALGYPVGRWKAGDITYIWTREGWLYLAVVIDLFSRKVVGWSMSSRMKARLVCDALRMAIWQRQPQAGLIVHTDHGSQYASRQHRKLLGIHGFVGSMSRTGDCFDNAVAESFFGSLKQELIHWRHYQTRFSAQQDVLQYISMFYNSHRLHSYLGYKSPNQYEVEIENVKKVA